MRAVGCYTEQMSAELTYLRELCDAMASCLIHKGAFQPYDECNRKNRICQTPLWSEDGASTTASQKHVEKEGNSYMLNLYMKVLLGT